MKYNEYLIKLLDSLGLTIEDGFIYENDTKILKETLPLVLPTSDHMKSLIDEKDFKLLKLPFNPLHEDIFMKSESFSFELVRKSINARLKLSIYLLGTVLLEAAKPDAKKKNGYEITKFLSGLSEVYKSRKIASEVDKKSLTNWTNFILNNESKDSMVIQMFVKKNGTVGETKFNRVATIYSPFLDTLTKAIAEKDKNILGVDVRLKDPIVYSQIIKFILADLDKETFTLKVGSNDAVRPSFISSMQLYIALAKRINKIAKECVKIDQVIADAATIPLDGITGDEEELARYNGEVNAVPAEKDLRVQLKNQEKQESGLGLDEINKANANKSRVTSLIKATTGEESSGEVDEWGFSKDGSGAREEASLKSNKFSVNRIYDQADEYDISDKRGGLGRNLSNRQPGSALANYGRNNLNQQSGGLGLNTRSNAPGSRLAAMGRSSVLNNGTNYNGRLNINSKLF